MDLNELIQFVDSIKVEKVDYSEFEEAVNKVKACLSMSPEEQLQFYGLYKQSTIGPCNTNRPLPFDILGTSKWDSWKQFESLSKEKAQLAYIYLVNNIIESTSSSSMTVISVSTLINHEENEKDKWSDSEEIYNFVVTNNTSALRDYLKRHPDKINITNEDGLTPLHYAADRGYPDIVMILLEENALINCVDNFNQTPLMYAALCDNENVFKMLVDGGADLDHKNNDDETVESMNKRLYERITSSCNR